MIVGSEGFSQPGLNTNRIKKREPVRPHTAGRTRNTHAVWLVTDASDRADVDMDESADPDGLGEEVTDTVGTARVLAVPRTPTKTEREEHDVSHVPYRPWCRFSWVEDWRDFTWHRAVTVMMTDPECLLTTATSAGTQHHC